MEKTIQEMLGHIFETLSDSKLIITMAGRVGGMVAMRVNSPPRPGRGSEALDATVINVEEMSVRQVVEELYGIVVVAESENDKKAGGTRG